MFCNIVRFDISDQMAAALANGFLTDFGILRADSPEQRRIDPQEIAREKVRISTKLEQERNAEFHSSNQSISQLDTCVEGTVVEDSDTLIKLEQMRNSYSHSVNQSICFVDIKVEEKNVVEDSDTLTKVEQEGNADTHSCNQSISHLDIKVEVKMEENDVEDMLTSPDISLTVGSGNSWSYSTMKQWSQ